MHEPITQFPKGTVVGSCRLAKGQTIIDLTRIRYGSRTRFVEKVTVRGKFGPMQAALRLSDDFPSDKIADRFIGEWTQGLIQNQGYRLVHRDPQFVAVPQHKSHSSQV